MLKVELLETLLHLVREGVSYEKTAKHLTIVRGYKISAAKVRNIYLKHIGGK